jgi:hypothetical protein
VELEIGAEGGGEAGEVITGEGAFAAEEGFEGGGASEPGAVLVEAGDGLGAEGLGGVVGVDQSQEGDGVVGLGGDEFAGSDEAGGGVAVGFVLEEAEVGGVGARGLDPAEEAAVAAEPGEGNVTFEAGVEGVAGEVGASDQGDQLEAVQLELGRW